MARGISSLLCSTVPTAAVPASLKIGHVQLRDLVVCPHESGVVTYVQDQHIVEHDLTCVDSAPKSIAEFDFIPNSIASMVLPDTHDTLLAAGGQEAQLHLFMYASNPQGNDRQRPRSFFGRQTWKSADELNHHSINNSVLLTSLSLTSSHESSVEPRAIVSNNDRSVKFFDIATRRSSKSARYNEKRLMEVGHLQMNVPINHSSISPDGRTLLSVGDSPDVYLHRVTGGAHISFEAMSTLSLSAYIDVPPTNSAVLASFSSAFSADGSKYAVASQEGVVVVWDVRSTKPLKVFQTDKTRSSNTARAGSGTSDWSYYESPIDWARGVGRAPGWGVRSVKFSPLGAGREVMTFAEHTSLLHVVDARTFETEEVVRVPSFNTPAAPLSARPRSRSPSQAVVLSETVAMASPSQPRNIALFNVLQDTFRIGSVSDNSASSALRQGGSASHYSRNNPSADDDVEGIVVIPPFGDREVENDVRRLLNVHGLRTRSRGARDDDMREVHDDVRPAEEMDVDVDVDELEESDCLSSRAPSPVPAPSPPAQTSPSTRPLPVPELLRVQRPALITRRESSGPYIARRSTGGLPRRHRRSGQPPDATIDQDLAGMCFDPSGTFVYVAALKGVAEWRIQGAEQRWWLDPTWA